MRNRSRQKTRAIPRNGKPGNQASRPKWIDVKNSLSDEELKAIRELVAEGCVAKSICDVFGVPLFFVRALYAEKWASGVSGICPDCGYWRFFVDDECTDEKCIRCMAKRRQTAERYAKVNESRNR